MQGYLQGKVIYVIGDGGDKHRGVALALAEKGADVAVGGLAPELPEQAALHSIANEIWAMGRRSMVGAYASDDATAFAAARAAVTSELGVLELIVRCESS